MLTVRDIMTADVLTLDFDASAGEAAWSLTRHRIGGAPVIDGDGHAVGMLTQRDLVDPAPADWIAGEASVGDRMAPKLWAVYADDPALAAVQMMALRKVHRLVVLDERSALVGIVSTMDVVQALARGDQFSVEEPAAASPPPTR